YCGASPVHRGTNIEANAFPGKTDVPGSGQAEVQERVNCCPPEQWIDSMKSIGSDRYDASHGPHPEEVTRSLRQARLRASSTRYGVTVSKDGRGHDFAYGCPSRRRALKKRAPPQDEG